MQGSVRSEKHCAMRVSTTFGHEPAPQRVTGWHMKGSEIFADASEDFVKACGALPDSF